MFSRVKQIFIRVWFVPLDDARGQPDILLCSPFINLTRVRSTKVHHKVHIIVESSLCVGDTRSHQSLEIHNLNLSRSKAVRRIQNLLLISLGLHRTPLLRTSEILQTPTSFHSNHTLYLPLREIILFNQRYSFLTALSVTGTILYTFLYKRKISS